MVKLHPNQRWFLWTTWWCRWAELEGVISSNFAVLSRSIRDLTLHLWQRIGGHIWGLQAGREWLRVWWGWIKLDKNRNKGLVRKRFVGISWILIQVHTHFPKKPIWATVLGAWERDSCGFWLASSLDFGSESGPDHFAGRENCPGRAEFTPQSAA